MDFTQSHGHGPQTKISLSNGRSPLSPGSGSSGTPISFQPNVNRAKTKRWVEARQYSYDGDEWGDNEEEEEETPAPVLRPPYATQHNGSSSELSSGRLSGFGSGADDLTSTVQKQTGGEQKPLQQKPPPFVRPTDLYKRMQAEKAAQQVATDGNAPTPNSLGDSPQTIKQASSIGLPEVRRMSAFDTGFLGSTENHPPEHTNTDQPALQHNPSSGYRSVVHQAFDVPETPDSTTTSVERSNSDRTSVISPIIGGYSVEDDRTPTILEDPNEASPSRENANGGPVFNPGHRRDLSLPSSDNSPSKRPQLTDQETPTADRAEVSFVSPPLHDIPQPSLEPHHPSMQPYYNNGQDRPAPLRFGSASGSDSNHSQIPMIIGEQESPQHTDNDRLREEIIQSLSREATPSEDPELRDPNESKQLQSQAPAAPIPHQFQNHWEDTTSSSTAQTPKPLAADDHFDHTRSHPLASQNFYANSQGNSSSVVTEPPKKAKLERRFSWESSDAEETEPQISGSHESPLVGTSLSMQEPEPIAEDTLQAIPEVPRNQTFPDNETSDSQRAERPRLSIILPVSKNASPPEQISGPGVSLPQQPQVPSITKNPALDESQLLGFRDIMGITSINQRIKSFEHTRDQSASLDTGLNQWLQFMVHEHSEYSDVVQKSQNFSLIIPASSPSRSRFLTSLGNLGSSNDASNSASHMRRSSAHLGSVINRQNVGDKGKEFLHTAGAFSGKASGAARGLFAKGRSKFRPSGASDKGQSTLSAPRRSFQFSLPSGSGDVSGKSSLQNSVALGSLPSMFKSRNAEGGSSNSIQAVKSGDKSKSHNVNGGTTLQQKHLSDFKDIPPETGQSGKAKYAEDLEQEMIAALGLSPTNPLPQRSVSTPLNSSRMNGHVQRPTGQSQLHDNKAGRVRSVSDMPVKISATDKDLPLIPTEPFDGSSGVGDQMHQKDKSAPSDRPFFDESTKLTTPPKDRDDGLAPGEHTAMSRQSTASTLGSNDGAAKRISEDDNVDRATSSIRLPQNKIGIEAEPPQNADCLLDGNSNPRNKLDPSTHEDPRRIVPFYPCEPPSSSAPPEAKRTSIGGLSTCAPGVQSPLRNEVTYSPGTRSSMLSYGSFGRQRTNIKGARPATPANGLSQTSESESPAAKDETTIERLKNFGRRRRSSVGDYLSNIQQQGIQGTPESQRKRALRKISGLFGWQDSRTPENQSCQRARATSEPPRPKELSKPPSTIGIKARASSVEAHSRVSKDFSGQQHLPTKPTQSSVSPTLQPSGARRSSLTTPQRASISLPPSSSTHSLFSAPRFYSQLHSGTMNETPVGSHHTRSVSHSFPGRSRSPSPTSIHETRAAAPLSPLEEVQDHQIQQMEEDQVQQESQQTSNMYSQFNILNENREQQEQEEHRGRVFEEHRHELHEDSVSRPSKQHPEVQVNKPEQPLDSRLNVQPRKPAGTDSFSPVLGKHATSSVSLTSSHPHRCEREARLVNDPPAPVELAITVDDSSEEIIMSPTTYPGQEWTPMHL